ncbi:hypothetical protein BDV98DRAFT_111486 [Pterulicium gracile]|uniref:Uncharacterized protein n=1 Tax=Pterulicium gracile TaxID=1884261 RepID=A0A5C3QE15_9AGAR|nr:hypothetical protein BDV98DRAFT_111486 [Pterula gracilis]
MGGSWSCCVVVFFDSIGVMYTSRLVLPPQGVVGSYRFLSVHIHHIRFPSTWVGGRFVLDATSSSHLFRFVGFRLCRILFLHFGFILSLLLYFIPRRFYKHVLGLGTGLCRCIRVLFQT